MARPSIHPILYQAEGGGSASVSQFDSVIELIDASQTGLAVGYYEVAGTWLTYWNGFVFFPTPEESLAGLMSAKGFRPFKELASDPGSVTFIAPHYDWPGIKDYNDLYESAELSSNSSAPDDALLYLTNNRLVGSYPYKEALRITGDVIIRSYLRWRGFLSSGDLNICDFSGPGETEATNFLYWLLVRELYFTYFNETGAGVNEEVRWWYPNVMHLRGQRDCTIEMRRESGDARVFLNGSQLRKVVYNLNGTVNPDGSFSVNPMGGESNLFCKEPVDVNTIDMGFIQVLTSTEDTSQEYAEMLAGWTEADLYFLNRNDTVDRASDANIVAAIEATETGLVDYAADPIEFSTANPPCIKLLGDYYWTPTATYLNGVSADGSAKTRISGDLTIQCLFSRESTADLYLMEQQASGETLATNYMWRMQVRASQLVYFHEYPAVSNATVGWSTPTLRLQEIREYRIVRENAGPDQNLRAYCRLFGETEWTQLTVDTVTPGTGAGTLQATIPAQGGGDSTNLSIDNTGAAHIKQVLIYNAAIDP